MKKFIIISIIIVNIVSSYSQSNDDLIVSKISAVLIKEYDNYEDKTFMERLVLKIGKPAFIDSIALWKNSYSSIESIKIVLHPKIEYIVGIGDKNLEKERAERFRSLFVDITRLAYKNLDIYYIATKEYLKDNDLTPDYISKELIEEAICQVKYYEKKKRLYETEEIIKKEIREIMEDKRIKYKLGIYIFAFDFLNKIRRQIIAKDMKKMEETIKNQE